MGIAVLSWVRFEECDQLFEGLCRDRWMNDNHVRRHGSERDRRKVLERIVRKPRVEAGIDHEARSNHCHRIAIRCRSRAIGHSKVPASTGLIPDVELTTKA